MRLSEKRIKELQQGKRLNLYRRGDNSLVVLDSPEEEPLATCVGYVMLSEYDGVQDFLWMEPSNYMDVWKRCPTPIELWELYPFLPKHL